MVDKLRDGAAEPRAGRRAPARGGGSRGTRRRASSPAAVWSDLPLFPEPRAPEPIVRGSRPSANRPLAVRRRTPRVARRRLREDRAPSRREFGALGAEGVADGVRGAPARSSGPLPAALARRLAAGVADLLLLASVDGLVVVFTARLLGLPLESTTALPWLPLVAFLILLDLAIVVTMTSLGGQTLGKMAFGVRVVRGDGGPVTVSRALVRTLLSVLSILPAGLGFVGLLAGSRRACHDWLAGTRVVHVVHT